MKKSIFVLILLFTTVFSFAQSKQYKQALQQAKDFEAQKRWAYALGSYYDAIMTDDAPEFKQEAYEAFEKLSVTIKKGQPGYGKFNIFSFHDSWQQLLIDAEKYGTEYGITSFSIPPLELGEINYKTKTVTYNGTISGSESLRANYILYTIVSGYRAGYKNDWDDMPSSSSWPEHSVQSPEGNKYLVNDSALYVNRNNETTNAWFAWESIESDDDYSEKSLYDLKINIADKNGKELVKAKRVLLDINLNAAFSFEGVSADVMELIENGEAALNLVDVYLEYGKYNPADNKGGRSFIKNFPEIKFDKSKLEITYGNEVNDLKSKWNAVANWKKYLKSKPLVENFSSFRNINLEKPSEISDFCISYIEVPLKIYVDVMGYNPAGDTADQTSLYKPVTNVSYYDAVVFCNKYSALCNLTPCYSVNGVTDPDQWDYVPGSSSGISDLKVNFFTDGLRLPTSTEWKIAFDGTTPYTYSGSDNYNDVAVCVHNSSDLDFVGTKAKNTIDLYDMSGNAGEMTESGSNSYWVDVYGGSYQSDSSYCKKKSVEIRKYERYRHIGFRIIQSTAYIDEIERQKKIQEEKEKERVEKERLIEEKKNAAKNFTDFSYVEGKYGLYSFEIAKLDTPQYLYKEIMDENPSFNKDDVYAPVTNLSWYDIIVFCNKLSQRDGLVPCYKVNNTTDVSKWNYVPHIGNRITSDITCVTEADGYRLPNISEYLFAKNSASGFNDLHEDFIWGYLKSNYYSKEGFRLIRSKKNVEIVTIENKVKDLITNFTSFAIIKGDSNTDSFAMSKIEVPEEIYSKVMGTKTDASRAMFPVTKINWLDAIIFCNKFSIQQGLEPCYAVDGKTDPSTWKIKKDSWYGYKYLEDGTEHVSYNKKASGYRLPTLQEWQYAANAGKPDDYESVVWHGKNKYKNIGENESHRVGSKEADSLGLYDMLGNVREWVWDNSGNSRYRYFAGGCYESENPDSSTRRDDDYYGSYNTVGFRIMRRLTEEEAASIE